MNTVRVLCIGDPHFKRKNVRDTDKMMHAILNLIITRTIDFVVILGDVLDKHGTIHESPLSRATDFIRKIQNLLPTYVLIGNHDMVNNSVFLTSENPFNSLKYWDNTIIVDVPLQTIIGGHTFTFMPYVYPGRFMEAMNTMYGYNKEPVSLKRLEALSKLFSSLDDKEIEGKWKELKDEITNIQEKLKSESKEIFQTPDYSIDDWKNSTCIFAHQEFKGSKMGAIISEVGDEWPLSNPLIVTGHIHDYDKLQDNLIITGTPLQHAFGDRSDKTVSLFTFYPDKTFSEERIDLKIPKKVIMTVNYEDIENTVIPENSEVKIIIVGNTSQISISSKLTKVKEWIKNGIKVAYRDISDIDLKTQKYEKVLGYEELVMRRLESLDEKQSKSLIPLFKEIVSEI